jgi:3-phytase/alkaline phosphatase D
MPRRTALVAGTVAVLVTSLALPAAAIAPRGPSAPLEYLGDTTIPAGMPFDGTVVGGLSSITYDASRGVYYALSDDQGAGFTPTSTPSRFYTLHIDVSDGSLDPGDVTVLSTTTLLGLDGQPFPAQSLDPEGMTLTPQHTLVVTSEGISNRGIPPFVREFAVSGQELRDLPVPGYFDPTGPDVGVRNNLGFEAAAVTPDGQRLVVGTENALVQDGPAATISTTSPARILSYHIGHGGSDREYVYNTDPVVAPSPIFTVNGLVELLPLNQQFMLAMERSFSVGVGNDIRIYKVALPGATNVSGVPDLQDVSDLQPAQKSLLLHLPATVGGQPLDNVEGMTLGPLLPDGRRAVLMVSDNNFTMTPTPIDSQVLLAALG